MYNTLSRTGRMVLAVQRTQRQVILSALSTAAADQSKDLNKYETLAVSVPNPFVYHVELNRPKKLNAFNRAMWIEIGQCFTALDDDSDCRVIVLSGAGRVFTAGIDLNDMVEMFGLLAEEDDVARKCRILIKTISSFQFGTTSLEKCRKPVICAVHNACMGAGLDLITAADIRMCTEDAWFQSKEVDLGMAADVGTLQRLPRIIGSDSLVRELVYTARKMDSIEAKDCGLVSSKFADKETMISEALKMAVDIAAKSPVGVQGTKMNLIYSRDHTVEDGLNHINDYNMTMLQSEDFLNATMAQATKGPTPIFSKL